MRRTAGNKEIDWQNSFRTIQNFGMIAKWAAGDRARTDCDHNLRVRHGLVGLLEREPHVPGNGTGDEKTVRMAGRRHELDAEASKIEDDGIKDVNVRFASVASAGADLPELERAAENAVNVAGQAVGELQSLSSAHNQVGSLGRCKAILSAELDRPLRTRVGTFRAKEASPEIHAQLTIVGYCVGRACVNAGFAAGWAL